MLYLEHTPAPPLDRMVRMLWYAQVPEAAHQRERILPTGNIQIILNLARDFLIDCVEGRQYDRLAPSQIVGARSVYEIIDTSDMTDLIGIVLQPGGLPIFAGDRADRFSNRSVDLETVWGGRARSLRDLLREVHTPSERLLCFEAFLQRQFRVELRASGPDGRIAFALRRFAHQPRIVTIGEVARETGWSERRFTQVFREQVGLTPKVWLRIQRFQRAVQQIHCGTDVRWTDLALECGFYDQSHFANEFRAFSGIDATTYRANRSTPWANHIRAE